MTRTDRGRSTSRLSGSVRWALGWGAIGWALLAVASAVASPLPGDVDGDGRLSHGDIHWLTRHLYLAGEAPRGSADANGDGVVDARDVVRLRELLGVEIPTFVHSDLPAAGSADSGHGWATEGDGVGGEGEPAEIFSDDFESGWFTAWSSVFGFDLALSCQPPDPGRATVGATVTLHGTDFLLGSTSVFFAGVEADLLSASTTTLDVEVPAGAGSGPVTVVVDDIAADGSVVCGDFVINHPPILDPIGDRVAPLGQTLAFNVVASDIDGDPLTLSVSPLPLPLGAVFDGATQTFTFSPDLDQVGSYALTFTVDDGESSASETVVVTVPEPAEVTSLAGLVLTTDDAPLPGVRLVFGVTDPVETYSQADGSFFLDALPVAGRQRLLIDGATVPGEPPGTYATVPEQVVIIEGGANVLEAPVYLLPLDLASADPVDFDQESLVTSSPVEIDGTTFPEIALTVAPSSATQDGAEGNGGSEFNGDVSITRIPSPELGPMPLPDDIELSVYIAVQPFGVRYDPPAEIAFPNVEGFPVGVVVDIFGLNHDTGRMEKVGDGEVDADGMIYSGTLGPDGSFTRHGVVRENSWHGFVPAPPLDGADPGSSGDGGGHPDGCSVGSEGCPRTGDLSVAHDLASYRSFGVDRALRFEYHSQHAFPHPMLSRLWTPGNLAPPPESMSTRLTVGGIDQGSEIFFDGPPCSGVSCPLGRFPAVFDASTFATGVYPAELNLSCNFPISRRDTTYRDTLKVINRIESPFGAGWSLVGLGRIYRTVTGDLLLTESEAEPLVFTPARRAAAEIVQPGERDFYRVAANAGERISLRLRRRSNQGDGSSTLDPMLELRDSRGFLLAADDNGGQGSVGGPGENAEILGLLLPATDTYTVVARGVGGTTGPYDLFLTSVTDTALVEGRSSPPEVVDPAFVLPGEIGQPGERDNHPFAASAGTRVTIEVDRVANDGDGSGTLDPAVELRDSQGFLIFSDNDSGSDQPPGPGRNALIASVDLPTTDTYSVVVLGSAGTAGPYEVRITFGDLTGGVDVAHSGDVVIEPVVLSPVGDYSTLRIDPDLGTFSRELKGGTVESYDAEGRLTQVADRYGNSLSYAYDGQGRLVSITDPVALVTTLVYGDSGVDGTCLGRLAEVHDPAGRTTFFEHDNRCNLVAIVDPDGAERRFDYDDDHLLVAQTSPRGVATPEAGDFVTEYQYDFSGRFHRSVLPDGLGRELVANQSLGLVPPPLDCDPPTPDLGCPGNLAPALAVGEMQVTFTDAEGRTRELGSLDALGYSTGTTDPLGRSVVVDRDLDGNPTRLVLPSGHTQTFAYDDRGNLTASFDEILQGGSQFTYEPEFEQITSWTNASGDSSSTIYDAQGNLVQLTSPEGRVLSYTYHPDGMLDTAVDLLGTQTRFVYDARGLVSEVRRGAGVDERVSTMTYTPAGNLATLVDPIGRTSTLAHDPMNRLLVQTLPGSRSMAFAYDEVGQLTELTAHGDRTHRFDYDLRDRLARYEPPTVGEGTTSFDFAYNGETQVLEVSRPDGTSIQSSYNPAGQLISVTMPSGSYTYSYNFFGALASLTSPGGETLSFDYLGSLPRRLSWSGSLSGNVSWSYDPNGLVASRWVNGGQQVDFTYDRDLLLTGAGDLTLERDVQSGLVASTELGSVTTTQGYNAFGELDDYRAEFGATTLYSASYERDKLGRITTKTEVVEGDSKQFAYTYDSAGRLQSVVVDGIGQAVVSWDASGNRLAVTSPMGTTSAVFDAQDRLIGQGNWTFSYNPSGELESRTDVGSGAVTTYDYDALGALEAVVLPDGRAITYTLDGLGRRIAKSVDGVRIWGLLYGDALNPVAQLDPTGQVLSRFVYGTRNHVPDTMVRGGVTYRIVSDHLGSPRLVVDSTTGAVAQRLDYDAFGRVVLDTNPGFQPFGFAGGIYDPDTGLVRFGARDYDAEVGRWTNKDPIGFLGGDENLYAYVAGDPVNQIDPSGLILDTIADVGFILYDLYRIGADNIFGDCDNLGENLAALGADVLGAAIPFATGAGAAVRLGKAGAAGARGGAKSAANAARLKRQLRLQEASQQQMAEAGTVIAGQGAKKAFRNADRVAETYGGNPADWVKKTSSSHREPDGLRFETHWVENIKTGQRVEFKTKFQ